MSSRHAFFVYGTLCPGGKYWPEIGHLVLRHEPARLSAFDLFDLPDGYPAIRAGRGRVTGELLIIASENADEATRICDAIEGFVPGDSGSLYRREMVEVTTTADPTQLVRAETYVFNRDDYIDTHGVPVHDGDWRAVSRTKQDGS